MGRGLRLLLGVVLVVVAAVNSIYAANASDEKSQPTHKQARYIKPKHQGQDASLLTYCVAKDGRLWLSVSSESRYGIAALIPGLNREEFNAIQVYSADGDLQSETPLPFKATAVNFGPDGSFFAAGQGKMARLNASVEIVATGPTPNIGDPEEFKKKVVEETKREHAEYAKQFGEMAQTLSEQLHQIESKAADERTEEDEQQCQLLKQQKEQFEQMVQTYGNQEVDPESAVQNSVTVTGIGATAEHVFLAISAAGGRGYEVWRTDHQFSDGKKVLGGLHGCCGNMDVQARGEGFVACENTRFTVAAYTQEGQPLSSFGKRDRNSPDGFGSCCNPMNCLCLENGDYIVAESSVGNIKRFNKDGEFLGLVGKARISGGCKHVSLGFDEKRSRYYMMNEDKNHICVLVPLSEAPAVTEEERLAAEATSGLGKKLVGRWIPDGQKDAPANGSIGAALSSLLFGGRQSSGQLSAEFLSGGAAKLSGGIFDNLGSELGWECVSQSNNVLQLSIILDGVELETVQVTFQDDDRLQFTQSSYLPTDKVFVRQTQAEAKPELSDVKNSSDGAATSFPAVRIR